jgi:hypothetical protein
MDEQITCEITSEGNKRWRLNGKLHRLDGPAVEDIDGFRSWWINGILHRDNDLPAVEWADGHKEWWINGKLHRESGPAIDMGGWGKTWWINGKMLDGCDTQEQFERLMKLRVFW